MFVEATGPNNTIAFQATGQENTLGALIDNVSLIPMAVVDEDGLVKGVNGDAVTGNHDSQPGDAVVPNNDNAPATGGDINESTSTGLLAVNWGADNYDAPDQYSNATGFTQDGVGREPDLHQYQRRCYRKRRYCADVSWRHRYLRVVRERHRADRLRDPQWRDARGDRHHLVGRRHRRLST